MSIESVNPATGETVRTYDEMTPQQTAAAVADAHEAWKAWRKTSFAERAKPMKKAAAILRERKAEFAKLMAIEMGKPLKQGVAETEKCAWVCEHYADNAEAYLAPEMTETDASKSYVAFDPLGVVLAVMPWNFPFWQVFRFAAPALMAGNAGVLKHASNVPGCALAIEEIFAQAGLPKNVFRTLLIGSKQVKAVIEHPLVRAVTLTGSTPAGKAVAAQAGAVIKKTVLELGGSDPYIVLEDADLDHAVNTCVTSRLINSGQSCVNAKRFIIRRAIACAHLPIGSLQRCARRRWAIRLLREPRSALRLEPIFVMICISRSSSRSRRARSCCSAVRCRRETARTIRRRCLPM